MDNADKPKHPFKINLVRIDYGFRLRGPNFTLPVPHDSTVEDISIAVRNSFSSLREPDENGAPISIEQLRILQLKYPLPPPCLQYAYLGPDLPPFQLQCEETDEEEEMERTCGARKTQTIYTILRRCRKEERERKGQIDLERHFNVLDPWTKVKDHFDYEAKEEAGRPPEHWIHAVVFHPTLESGQFVHSNVHSLSLTCSHTDMQEYARACRTKPPDMGPGRSNLMVITPLGWQP